MDRCTDVRNRYTDVLSHASGDVRSLVVTVVDMMVAGVVLIKVVVKVGPSFKPLRACMVSMSY